MEWLSDNKLPVGNWARQGTDWLIDNAGFAFDWLATQLRMMIDGLLWVFELPSPLIFILIAGALAFWRKKSIGFTLFVLAALLFIFNQGYWEPMLQTLALVIASAAVCMIIGVPVGIAAAHNPRFSTFLRPILDLMQTIPTFVYLIPALILFGLGMVPGLIATVIFAIPAPIRLTELGVRSSPRSLIEAGQAFGATKWQLLTKVELPWALPQIMAGLTQTIMLSLSMVVIAALVGAPGLGVPVVRALNTVNIGMGFEAGMVIVLVAILLDRFLRLEQKEA